MYLLVEKGVISEQTYGADFAYILEEDSYFAYTEYKVLQSQTNDLFVKCMKMTYNGKTQLFYCSNPYKSLLSLLPTLSAEAFFQIVGNLLSAIVEVKNNGFLSCCNVDCSVEHIYVDPNTLEIGLVYLPLIKHEYDDYSTFEKALRTTLIKLVSNYENLSSKNNTQLAETLKNETLAIEMISSDFSDEPKADRTYAKIVAMNASENIEFVVDKDEYKIGKRDSNDGVVNFNVLVSREHCKILRKNNQYVVVDLKSANGTYVNGERLIPNQNCPINNGDILRLANSDFCVVIK